MGKDTYTPIYLPYRGIDMATINEQIDLEYQMVQSGIDRFNKQLDDLLQKDLGSRTKHGRTIIKGIVQPVEEAIRALVKDKTQNRNITKKLIQNMKADQVAYLSLISLIDNIASKTTLLTVARNIGVQIETQKRLEQWLKLQDGVADNMIKEANKKSDKGFDHKRHGLNHKMKLDDIEIPNWTNEERVHVGIKMIDLIISSTGIVKLDKRINRNKTVWHVAPTEETAAWIKAFNDTNSVALPRYSPCIVQPKDWEGFWGGGYYSDHINKLPFVRVHT